MTVDNSALAADKHFYALSALFGLVIFAHSTSGMFVPCCIIGTLWRLHTTGALECPGETWVICSYLLLFWAKHASGIFICCLLNFLLLPFHVFGYKLKYSPAWKPRPCQRGQTRKAR